MLVDYTGKTISAESSILNGADVFIFGDSIAETMFGNNITDTGTMYARLAKDFTINSWTNFGVSRLNSWQVWGKFKDWATAANAAQYNKPSTVLLFVSGSNDFIQNLMVEYNGNQNTTSSTNGIYFICQKCRELFPNAFSAWILPHMENWSVFAGNTGVDFSERDIDPKLQYIINHLEANGMPYLNMRTVSGIHSDMLPDGVHPAGNGPLDLSLVGVEKYYAALRDFLCGGRGGAEYRTDAVSAGDSGTVADNFGNTIVFGDSLADGYHDGIRDPESAYSYVTHLRNSGRFGTVTNMSISGSAINHEEETWCKSAVSLFNASENSQTIANADTIILEYGGNDVSYVMAGKTKIWSVIQGLGAVLLKINQLNPDCKVIFVMSTASQTAITLSNYDHIHEYISACLATVCDAYRVQFIHMYTSTGVNLQNRGTYLQEDGTHLLPNLAEIVAKRILSALDIGETWPKPKSVTARTGFGTTTVYDSTSAYWLQMMGVSTTLCIVNTGNTFVCSPGWFTENLCQWFHFNTNGGLSLFLITIGSNGELNIAPTQLSS